MRSLSRGGRPRPGEPGASGQGMGENFFRVAHTIFYASRFSQKIKFFGLEILLLHLEEHTVKQLVCLPLP